MQSFHHFSQTSRLNWAIYALFYGFILNVPLWFAARSLGLLIHGWLCIDYLLLGVIAIILPRRVIPAVVVFFIALDVVSAICETYFLVPAQMFRNLAGILDFSAMRIFSVICTAFLVIATASIACRLKDAFSVWSVKTKAASLLFALAILCVTLDFLVGLTGTGQGANLVQGFNTADTVNLRHYTEIRVSRSPLRWLIRRASFGGYLKQQMSDSRSAPQTVPSAFLAATKTEQISQASSPGVLPDIVLIVVESWGEADDTGIRDALTAPYATPSVRSHYQLIQGEVPFYGATVDGEARELCGTTIGLHIIEASPQELKGCLPDRLSALGYHTTAIHGMDGNWFDRRTWYPAIGFQDVIFRDRLTSLGLPRCAGAFMGTCDGSIARWIGERLSHSSGPQFIYWMTLNSHLPVPNPPPLSAPVSCGFSARLSTSRALCAWFQLEANLHQAIAELAISGTTRPAVFVVVGDHAPPFSSSELRSGFSATIVPYIALIPTGRQIPDMKPKARVVLRANIDKANREAGN